MRSLRAASIIAVHLFTGCPPVSSLNYNACKTLPLDLYRAPRFCHITPLLTELHGLNIKHRIDFKIILTYKAILGAAPPNITDLISLKPNSKYGQRSNDTLLLQPPPYSWGQAFRAAAQYCGTHSLKSSGRNIESVLLRKSLKHIFSRKLIF